MICQIIKTDHHISSIFLPVHFHLCLPYCFSSFEAVCASRFQLTQTFPLFVSNCMDIVENVSLN